LIVANVIYTPEDFPKVDRTLKGDRAALYDPAKEKSPLNAQASLEPPPDATLLPEHAPLPRARPEPPLGMPLAPEYITSPFGLRKHPITGLVKKHTGDDMVAKEGAPVFASGKGRIEKIVRGAPTSDREHPGKGYGNEVIIDHGKINGHHYETRYGHLESVPANLRPGDTVQREQVIGKLGSSGLSTGPHLHYELLQDGVAINPFDKKYANLISIPAETRKLEANAHQRPGQIDVAEAHPIPPGSIPNGPSHPHRQSGRPSGAGNRLAHARHSGRGSLRTLTAAAPAGQPSWFMRNALAQNKPAELPSASHAGQHSHHYGNLHAEGHKIVSGAPKHNASKPAGSAKIATGTPTAMPAVRKFMSVFGLNS
jgi:murein DD-endopeptidase MepM/ murein hydrolase activator NlpD